MPRSGTGKASSKGSSGKISSASPVPDMGTSLMLCYPLANQGECLVTLPEYRHPPVKEVVLGVHFEALSRLGGPYIGLLWQEFRSLYGKVEEASPLVFHVERFGLGVPPDPPRIELIDSISPRIWLVNESETELLQIQQDWLSHNW